MTALAGILIMLGWIAGVLGGAAIAHNGYGALAFLLIIWAPALVVAGPLVSA